MIGQSFDDFVANSKIGYKLVVAALIVEELKKMKTLSTLIVIAVLTIAVLAQRAQNNSDEKLRARNAPDLFVFSASAFGPDKSGDSHFTIEVGNTGSKTITAIEWEYYRAIEGQNKSTDKFRSDKLRLLSNERQKLTGKVNHYSDDFVKSFNLDTVRIMRVEYEDGSSWQRQTDRDR